MNALLAIGSDAELAHGFEPFDDFDEIPLARRFRPFPQPGERRALFVFGDDEQGFQSCDRLWRQAFDEVPVSAFAGERARSQGETLQFPWRWQQDVMFAQIFDHGRNDCVAAIRSDRFIHRDGKKSDAHRGRRESRDIQDRFAIQPRCSRRV